MTTQPTGPRTAMSSLTSPSLTSPSSPPASSPNWYATSSTCNRSYLLAGLRAVVIALVLLGILAFIVLT